MTTTRQVSATEGVAEHVNEIRLVGRLSEVATERILPSGDRLHSFRLVVARPAGSPGRTTVDALECVAWSPRVQRQAARWRPGDVVAVEGSVRRRFYRARTGVASLVEVEVASGRVIRRAASA